MKYYKHPWNETRGDDHDDWGKSFWYFVVCCHSGITREQIEIYENGISLLYSEEVLMSDEYGGLSEVPFDLAELSSYEISKDEYESVKYNAKFKNQKNT